MGMFPVAIINAGIDARLPTTAWLSVHSAFSTSGSNEIAATVRALMGMDAAASRIASNSDAETIAIGAGDTVRWLGIFSASAAGTFHGMVPNGSTQSLTVVGLDTGDIIHSPAHGLADLGPVTFLNIDGSGIAGLAEGTVFYVKTTGKTADTFQVTAAADDGTAVAITTSGYAICFDIVEETFGSAGDLNVAAGALDIVGIA